MNHGNHIQGQHRHLAVEWMRSVLSYASGIKEPAVFQWSYDNRASCSADQYDISMISDDSMIVTSAGDYEADADVAATLVPSSATDNGASCSAGVFKPLEQTMMPQFSIPGDILNFVNELEDDGEKINWLDIGRQRNCAY